MSRAPAGLDIQRTAFCHAHGNDAHWEAADIPVAPRPGDRPTVDSTLLATTVDSTGTLETGAVLTTGTLLSTTVLSTGALLSITVGTGSLAVGRGALSVGRGSLTGALSVGMGAGSLLVGFVAHLAGGCEVAVV